MRKLKTMFFFLILMMVSFPYICVAEQEWGKINPEELQMTSFPEDPDADAIILFDKGEYIFGYVYPVTLRVHKRVKVFNKRGAEFANISIPFHHGEKIEGVEGFSVTRDGREYHLDSKQIFTKQGEYWDEVVFSLPGVEEGSVFEYRYERGGKNVFFLTPWYFQNEIFTKFSQITLNVKPGWLYSYFFRNPGMAKTEPKVQAITTGTEYVWTFENLPPIKEEPYVFCMNDYRMAVYFEESGYESIFYQDRYAFNTWEKWGNLVDGFYKSLEYDKSKIDQKAKELTQNAATDSEKVANIYDYVRQKIDWNGERGIFNLDKKFFGSFMTRQEGTGAEKNLLLLKLVQAAGIQAHPMLISTHDNGRVIRDKPGLIQFNHVIVRVKLEEQILCLDAVERLYPYGMLPVNDLEGYGLMLDGDKSYLTYISGDKVGSIKYTATKAKVSEEGDLACSTAVCYQGYYSPLARKQIMEKGKEEFFKQKVKDLAPSTVLDKIEHTSLDSINHPLEMSISFSADHYGQLTGEDFYINPTLFSRLATNPFESESRKYPVDFPYPITEIEDTELIIPDGFQVKEIPANVDREIRGIKFNKTYTVEGGRIKSHRQVAITQLLFPVSQYQELRNLYQEIIRADQLLVILTKKHE
jgi:hypothetical protein